MQKTMKRSKYMELVEKFGKEMKLSNSMIFDLKWLGAYRILITKNYDMNIHNLMYKINVGFNYVPTSSGEFVLQLTTRII